MINEGLIVHVDDEVRLYRENGYDALYDEAWVFARVGRRVLVQSCGFSTIQYREDIVTSQWETLSTLQGRLIGEAFGNFICAADTHFVKASTDACTWRIISDKAHKWTRCKYNIVDGALTRSRRNHGSSYTTDGVNWTTIPMDNITYVRGNVAYSGDLHNFYCFTNGIQTAQYSFDCCHAHALWRGYPVFQVAHGDKRYLECHVVVRDKKKQVKIPAWEVYSNGFAVTDGSAWTADLEHYYEEEGRIVVVDDMLVSLRDDGYKILHKPSPFEKAFYDLPRSRTLVASSRRLEIPFALVYLVSSF